jgi:hypothetical protein
MQTYNGFLDYLRQRQSNEQELILVRAKDDFIKEQHSGGGDDDVNWRPRKTYLDGDYIDENPESIVFYNDI